MFRESTNVDTLLPPPFNEQKSTKVSIIVKNPDLQVVSCGDEWWVMNQWWIRGGSTSMQKIKTRSRRPMSKSFRHFSGTLEAPDRCFIQCCHMPPHATGTGIHWNTLEYIGIHWNTLEYIGILLVWVSYFPIQGTLLWNVGGWGMLRDQVVSAI